MRTPESVRASAASHFAKVIEFAVNEDGVAAAREDEVLGMRLVDAALAVPPGELFKLNEHLPAGLPGVEAFALAMRVLPFLMGALRLLEMEFAHPTVGVVPYALVTRLMNDETLTHEGVELTAKNVFVQYRRRALS
jgi:hypothetical protein